MDENPTPYMAAFLGFTTFAHDLGIKTIRVDSVEQPNFFETTGKDIGHQKGLERIISVWDKCSKMAADYGMNVTWEFEPGFVFNKPSEVVQIVEAVHQVRRDRPPERQVADCDVALVSGHGGNTVCHSSLLLRRTP